MCFREPEMTGLACHRDMYVGIDSVTIPRAPTEEKMSMKHGGAFVRHVTQGVRERFSLIRPSEEEPWV